MPDDAPATVFDRRAVRLHRDRAAGRVSAMEPVLADLADRLLDRLDDTPRRFAFALDLGGRGIVAPRLRARGIAALAADLSSAMAARNGPPCVAADEEWLPFAPASFDLVTASVALHWVNDLPGTLLQIRRALAPDGLFLASLPVLGTVQPLRAALAEAETALAGGLSPRVSPFPTLSDCAALLQRAGFALPVIDLEQVELSYADPLTLVADLRAAGETNAIALRDRRIPSRALFPAALAALAAGRERINMPLHLAMLTAWAPAAPAAP